MNIKVFFPVRQMEKLMIDKIDLYAQINEIKMKMKQILKRNKKNFDQLTEEWADMICDENTEVLE